MYLKESSKGWGGGDQTPHSHVQSVLVPLFFVRVGEMDVKGLSNILGHFQVKSIVNLEIFNFRSF